MDVKMSFMICHEGLFMFGISGEAQNSWTGLLEKESGVESSTDPDEKGTTSRL